MPKIAQYDSFVPAQVSSQPTASSAAANAVFRSNDQLTQSTAQLVQAGVQIKQRIDTTSAEAAMVEFEREKNDLFFNPESGYFNLQGKNAFDGSTTVKKSLESLKKKYGSSLNSSAKLMFDKVADQYLSKSSVDIDRHASRGFKAWETATLESQVENTLENASLYWNQPDQLRVQNALGRQSIIDAAQQEGIGAEATNERLQSFDSSFNSATVQAAMINSYAAGKDAFDKYEKRLEPSDKIKIQKMLESKRNAEQTKAGARIAINTATRLVDVYDGREDIRQEVNKIDDPELRKKTMDESMRQFNFKQRARDESQSEAFENAESYLVDGMSVESFKLDHPEQWQMLSAKQKRTLESGKSVVTDWNTYSDLITLPSEQLAKINPNDYFDQLGNAERKKLINAVKSSRGEKGSNKTDHQIGRTRSSQTTNALEQVLGKKHEWNNTKRQQADTFYSLLDDELTFREEQKGESLTSQEFTQLLSDLTRKVTVERSLFGADILAPDAKRDVTDLDGGELDSLTSFLRENNIPVTIDNLMKAKLQASQ